MTLYLKYRPRSFADVVGQDHVVTTMERAVERGQLSHAYLLCGTRGTGKTSVARILAKIILISGIEDEVIQKQMIAGVEEGSLVDLIEIDAASNRRIDDVRDLIERINFSPVVAKAKVYIIDEVHMLTKEAFNALLKTLDEPPEYAYFILATTELHKVPDTIQSRCQRFLFKRVRDEDIIRRLQYIADQEHIKIDREALRAIARHATGSFRDAISLLDQLRSLEKISLAEVSDRIGRTSSLFIEELLQAVDAKDIARIPALVEEIEDAHIPLDVIVGDLLSVIRGQMHEDIARKVDPYPYVRIIDALLQMLKDLRISPVPGLVVESGLVGLCADAGMRQTSPVLSAPPTKESKARPTAVEPKAVVAEAAKPERPTVIEAEDFTLENVRRHWNDVVARVTPPSVRMSLKNAMVMSVDSTTLILGFPSAFHRDKVSSPAAGRGIEDILASIFKRQIKIEYRLENATAPIDTGPATNLVDAAEEVFGSL